MKRQRGRGGVAITLLVGLLALCAAANYVGGRSDAQTQALYTVLQPGMTREQTRDLAYQQSVVYHCVQEAEDLYLFVTSAYQVGLGVGLHLRFKEEGGQQMLTDVWSLTDPMFIGGAIDSCPNRAGEFTN